MTPMEWISGPAGQRYLRRLYREMRALMENDNERSPYLKRDVAKSLRRMAAKTGQSQHATKRQWLKTSHKERGKLRPQVKKAGQ